MSKGVYIYGVKGRVSMYGVKRWGRLGYNIFKGRIETLLESM